MTAHEAASKNSLQTCVPASPPPGVCNVRSGCDVLEGLCNSRVDTFAHGLDLLPWPQLKQLSFVHVANEVLHRVLPLNTLHELPAKQSLDVICTLHGLTSHIHNHRNARRMQRHIIQYLRISHKAFVSWTAFILRGIPCSMRKPHRMHTPVRMQHSMVGCLTSGNDPCWLLGKPTILIMAAQIMQDIKAKPVASHNILYRHDTDLQDMHSLFAAGIELSRLFIMIPQSA